MKTIQLNNLLINDTAKIYDLNCNEVLKRRLLDLGLIVGTPITPIFKSPLR